uniref:Uncharacterized protein n=1 Tax=Oryza glaberrima TaxID=4538 RepID=I1P1S5_ORYGL
MAIGEDDTCENKDCRVGAGRKAMAIGEDDTCENKDCCVTAGRKATTVGENGACENKDCRVGAGRKASAVEEDNACENKEKRRKMMLGVVVIATVDGEDVLDLDARWLVGASTLADYHS